MLGRIRNAIAAFAAAASGCFLLSAPVNAGEADLYAAAKKEGEVVFYTGLLQNQLVRPMVAAFEAKYPGVKVNVAGGTGHELALKVLAEAKAGVFKVDLFTPVRLDEIEKAGLLATYFPDAARNYPPHLKSADGKWTSINRYFYGLSVNSELVSEADMPKSLDDLLDPRWKGKIAWVASLGDGGPPLFVAAVLEMFGEEKGRAYLKRLAQQNMVKIPSNQRVVLDQVIAGQFPLALMTFHHHAYASAQRGAPVKWLNIDPVISTTSSIILLKHAPHPNAAKLLLEFILSADGANIFSAAGYAPAHPDVAAAIPTVAETATRRPPMTFIPPTIDANMPRWIDIYLELFLK